MCQCPCVWNPILTDLLHFAIRLYGKWCTDVQVISLSRFVQTASKPGVKIFGVCDACWRDGLNERECVVPLFTVLVPGYRAERYWCWIWIRATILHRLFPVHILPFAENGMRQYNLYLDSCDSFGCCLRGTAKALLAIVQKLYTCIHSSSLLCRYRE